MIPISRLHLFLPEIKELHRRGWSSREIANALRGENLRDKKPPNWIDPTEATVYHFIHSLDIISFFNRDHKPAPWDELRQPSSKKDSDE